MTMKCDAAFTATGLQTMLQGEGLTLSLTSRVQLHGDGNGPPRVISGSRYSSGEIDMVSITGARGGIAASLPRPPFGRSEALNGLWHNHL